MMPITDVAWTLDGQGRPVLELRLGGREMHARSSQRPELLALGIVEGLVFLESDRSNQIPNAFLHGSYAPAFAPVDLIGCTDDPRVFALYQSMCTAIRTGAFRPGPQSSPQ